MQGLLARRLAAVEGAAERAMLDLTDSAALLRRSGARGAGRRQMTKVLDTPIGPVPAARLIFPRSCPPRDDIGAGHGQCPCTGLWIPCVLLASG
jgi:hypothetical protein